MTTARNLLYADLTKVLAAKSNETVRERILRTLEKYRVQMKPGATLANGMTAREALFKDIIETCTMISTAEIPRRIQVVIDRYRMQAKQNSKADISEKVAISESPAETRKTSSRKTKGVGKNKQLIRMEPLGGGPVKRAKTR